MKNTILFDLDGTLLDTLKDLTLSINYMLKAYNHKERTEVEIRSFLGNGALRLVELAIGEKLSAEDLLERYNYYDAYYEAHKMDHTGPYDGILDVLETLKKKGYKLGVISNKQDQATKGLVAEIFKDTFDYALGVKNDGIKKPDRQMVDECLKALGSKPEEAYLVGDSEVDIQTGKNAGVLVIACLWGFRDMKDIAPLNPEFIIGKPTDLLKII